MAGILAFGSQPFTKEILDCSFAVPVVATASDMVSVSVQLKQFPEAKNVVVGFENSLDFTIELAYAYRDRRFFLVLDPPEINIDTYTKALNSGIEIIDHTRLQELLGFALGRNNSNIIQQDPIPYDAIHSVERNLPTNVRPPTNQVLTIVSSKGGVGKSTIGTSMAVDIASWAQKEKINYKVCFVDGDTEGSRTASLLLGISKVPQSLKIWAEMDQRPKWSDLQNLLIKHESGLWVLPAPQSFSDAINTKMSTKLAEDVIATLKENFNMIILDMGCFVKNDAAVRSMQLSSKVYVVFEPTLPVIQLIKSMSEENVLGGKLGVDLTKVKLIANTLRPTFNIHSVENLAEALNLPVATILPMDENVLRAEESGQGKPLTLINPKSPFSLGIKTLSRLSIESELYRLPSENKGLMSFIKRITKKRKPATAGIL